MYLATNVHITFPEFKGEKRTSPRKEIVFKSVNSFKIDKTWQSLTDTCEFVIAKRLYLEEKGRVFELIQPGDPFYIDAGYNGEYNREFNGFISEILDDLPVTFKCEDNMYILKRKVINKSYKNIKLSALLKDIIPSQFKIDCPDVVIGDFLFPKWSVSQILQELKDKCGFYSYFNGDTLVCFKIFEDNPKNQTVKFTFNKNVIANDLKYRKTNDYRIKVTAISRLTNGKKIKEIVGDLDGVEAKLYFTNVKDRAALIKMANAELTRLRYDGYRGSLTGFGIPFVEHGYTAEIINPENPERNAKYYVNGVTTTLDNKGAIRRNCKIGKKAAK